MSVDAPDQAVLFRIEGRDVWCQNLGPTEVVAEAMCQWLGSIDYGERQ